MSKDGSANKGFRPDQSGIPSARPKSRPITEALTRIGESAMPEPWRKRLGLWKGATWFDGIAMAMYVSAAKGNPATAKEISDRVEGKHTQRLELVDLNLAIDIAPAREKLLAKLTSESDAHRPSPLVQ
jgi:hypothetical protein